MNFTYPVFVTLVKNYSTIKFNTETNLSPKIDHPTKVVALFAQSCLP